MTEIITRADAKARGLKRYFTGRACKHGHVAERITSGGSCYECVKLAQKTPRAAELRRKREHTPARQATYARYRKSAKRKAVQHRYNISDKNKAAQKRYAQSENGKAVIAAWLKTPKAVAWRKAYQLEYGRRPHVKARRKAYFQSPEGKEALRRRNTYPKARERQRRQNHSPKGKERQHRYAISDKNKALQKRYAESVKGRKSQDKRNQRRHEYKLEWQNRRKLEKLLDPKSPDYDLDRAQRLMELRARREIEKRTEVHLATLPPSTEHTWRIDRPS